MSQDDFLQVPTVDISAFLGGTSADELAKEAAVRDLVAAVSTYGSFWVKLPVSEYSRRDRDNYLDSISHLFQVEPHNRVFHDGVGVARGYIKVGGESGASGNFEHKEGFSYGYSQWEQNGLEPSNDMEAHNVWPRDDHESPFSHQDRMTLEGKLFNLCTAVGDALVRMFSLDLCGSEHTLADDWRGGETTHLARLFRYFPDSQLPESFSKEQYRQVLGSSPHTDWGLLTVILADDTPGLELLWTGKQVSATKVGSEDDASEAGWKLVRPEFDQAKLFVNTGDFMSIVSGGRYISPLHRVVLPRAGSVASQERNSCVFFYYPRYDANIPTLSNSCKQTYSVFTDQAKDGGGSLTVDDASMTFGSFISKKWASVTRKP
mmetsp:Transcript_66903/g.160186  ORF Transcript_66903/g.160186 Transcript_66903/m.160186 type:complete len:376 (+) Transcript_66903:82-1209(+)